METREEKRSDEESREEVKKKKTKEQREEEEEEGEFREGKCRRRGEGVEGRGRSECA
jgi:hypothetical protein